MKRGCAGCIPHRPPTAWRAVHRDRSYMKADQVQPSRLARIVIVFCRGHPLLRRVCTSVTHSIAFQAITNLRNLNYQSRLPFALPPYQSRCKVGGKSVKERYTTRVSSSLVRRNIGGSRKDELFFNYVQKPYARQSFLRITF